MRTHVVTNVVPAPSGLNVLRCDAALSEAVDRWVAPADPAGAAALDDLGALAGTPEVRQWADQADRVTPVLRTHAPTGERVDEVEFHPAYHQLMRVAVGNGLTAEPWTRPADCGAHARRAAGFVVWSQVEAGHLCPVSMTLCRRAGPRDRARPGGTLAARSGVAHRTTPCCRRWPTRPG